MRIDDKFRCVSHVGEVLLPNNHHSNMIVAFIFSSLKGRLCDKREIHVRMNDESNEIEIALLTGLD